MKRYYIVLCLLVMCFSAIFVNGQGCSDAGACSIPAFKPSTDKITSEKNNQLNVGLSVGVADHSIFVLTPQIGYSRLLGSSFRVDGQVTAALHSGNGVSTSGLGDIFVNINYLLSSKFSFSGGMKIPLSDGGRFYTDEIVFPMDYQSSLGTLDLIAGVSYKSNGWQFNFAYQQPLTQNSNWFYPDSISYPESPFNDFQKTACFIRKGDVLMHITRSISFNDRFTLMPGLLPIYHLGEDEICDNFDGFESIEGSDGLTLNATLHAAISLNKVSNLNLNIGFPLIVRKVRPDGLTRSFVLGAEYSVSF